MRRLFTAIAMMVCLLASSAAWATPDEDFRIYQLGSPADAASHMKFRLFANQLGVALSGFNFETPSSGGHTGFNVGLEYGAAKINHAYWPRFSGGDSDYVLMPALHVRKGLGFSFELGARVSYLQNSSMVAGTLELKWALNEGLRYAPDFAVRGYVTRLFGASDFDLTTAGIDVGIGKRFGIAGVMTLTPYLGWNLIFVHADSRMIETNPTRTEEEAMQAPFSTLSYYDKVELSENYSNRFYGGLRFVFNVFEIALEFSYTKISIEHDIAGVPTWLEVWNFGGKLGVDF